MDILKNDRLVGARTQPAYITKQDFEHAVEHSVSHRLTKAPGQGDQAKAFSHKAPPIQDSKPSPIGVKMPSVVDTIFSPEEDQVAQRERLVGAIALKIRHTLNFNDLVTIAAQELSKLLAVDRVEIVKYLPELGLWRHLAEYCCDPQADSLMWHDIPDQDNALAERLKRFEVVHIEDVASMVVDDVVNREFAKASPGSWLLLPIVIDGAVWGSLNLLKHQSGGWTKSQIDLGQAAVDQLAIAIEHSKLYHQIQQLNEELEQTVKQRTAQLSQALASESMLKRITDKVRDSLDEQHILETAVQELAQLLGLEYCDTGLYDTRHQTCTIAHDYNKGFPSAKGKVIAIHEHCPDIYDQLLHGQYAQFCLRSQDGAHTTAMGQTVLACPIFDNQGVLGDLWLFRPAEQSFDDLEVRLVQQVTNQCAIGIRQARLYQAAQNQVEALEHISQLKDNFLSTVSHELRTPISSIKMAIQMLTLALGREGLLPDLNKPAIGPNKIAHYLKILNDECNREIGLITDLLDLQQLEAGTSNLSVQPIELSSYLHRLLRPFQEQVVEQRQMLVLDIPEHLPAVLSDAQSLERILVELLTNACKYTPAGETISLSVQVVSAEENRQDESRVVSSSAILARSPASVVVIRVTNSGVEIAPDQLSRIFDKFYRVPNSDPHRHSGTGLGLALVKKLALRIGCRLVAESGDGLTCFTVELPVHDA